jgi:alpha-glucosidase
VRPDELHLAFNFALLWEEWDAAGMRAAIHATLDALGAVGAAPTWVLENHDVVRLPTRYGSRRRARAAALLLLALPGTVFLYAGQELGLEEADLADEHRRDPLFARTGGARKGRDGCRIPLPWTQREPGLGFTSGKPWLPVPPEWAEQSVEAQREDPHSMLELYREALARRRELAGAPFAWLDDAEETLSFARGHVVCTVNAASDDIPMPGGELLLASEPGLQDMLPPDTAAWVRTTDDERSALR